LTGSSLPDHVTTVFRDFLAFFEEVAVGMKHSHGLGARFFTERDQIVTLEDAWSSAIFWLLRA